MWFRRTSRASRTMCSVTESFSRTKRKPKTGRRLCDKAFLFAVRVVDFQLEYETVDLCFRQRVGSLLLDRVLRCENEERFGHFERGSGDGRLFFLHALQQGALDFCGRAVDFIREDDVCKNGSLFDRESVFLRIVDVCSDNVGEGRNLS